MHDSTLPIWPPGVHELRLGTVSIDLRYRRVTSSAGTVELSQRPFDLLCLFLAEPHVLHTRSDLFARVWKGVVVEDANLSQSVWLVRNALGEAKAWLRTVAKSGYVFEPPVELVILHETYDIAAAPTPAPIAERDIEPVAEPAGRRGRIPWLVVALVVLAAAGIAAGWLAQRYVAPGGPVRIVLIDLNGDAGGATAKSHWSLALLHAWIEWRLSSEPDAVVVEAPRLAAVDESGDLAVVLLSAETDPLDESRLRLAAHVTVKGTTRSLGGNGAQIDVAPRIDALSREVVVALVKNPVALDTPPLDLDLDAARRYTDALTLRSARRATEAVAAFDAVTAAAPDFGLAYAQQATLLSSLGRARAARESQSKATEWLARLPAAAAQIARAEALMTERDFVAAAVAYADLSVRYPAQPVYVIERGRALYNNREARRTLEVLSAIDWERQPPSILTRALILRANAELANNNLARARKDAQRADDIANRNGWPRQRGEALLVVARVVMIENAGEALALFEESARQSELGGSRSAAVTARLYAEVRRHDDDTRLNALIEETRAIGDSNLEAVGLRAAAARHSMRGEFRVALELLLQAEEILRNADVKYATGLPGSIVQLAYYLGDFATAERRLEQSPTTVLQACVPGCVAEMIAGMAFRRGRFPDVDADPSEQAGSAADHAGLDLAFGCIHAEIAMRRGDITVARTAADRCAANGRPTGPIARDLVLARIALLGGDAADALRRLDEIDAALQVRDDDVLRWHLEIIAVQLRLQAGDVAGADARLASLRERLVRLQAPIMQADLLLASAESALAQDHLDEASQWLSRVKPLLLPDDWIGSSRARIVEAVLAARRGQGGALDALNALVVQAREHGDVMLVIAITSLVAPADVQTADLRTRTGLRNNSLRWLLGSDHPKEFPEPVPSH